MRHEHLDAPDVEYDAKKGKLIKKEAQEDWVSYNNAADAMSLVEFLSYTEAEKERQAREKLRLEKQQQQQILIEQQRQSPPQQSSSVSSSSTAQQLPQQPTRAQPASRPPNPPARMPVSQ